MSDQQPVDPLTSARRALQRAEQYALDSTPSHAQAWATIGLAHAQLAQLGQQHLLAMIHQYQALVALVTAGAQNDATVAAMSRLEERITEGLGL